MHPDPTWIVVADSQAVRFFLRSHWGEPLKELAELADSADFLDGRSDPHVDAVLAYPGEIVGRVIEQDRIESVFLHRVARSIDDVMTRYAAQGLVLCAPPRELCLLRDYISPSSLAKITCELSADLVKASASVIDAEMLRLKA
ncbi:MAG: host attachment protein [Hyphomonadaceae bacterium]|nr:host attachment protein [Hyphomonadaceae bacterium]